MKKNLKNWLLTLILNILYEIRSYWAVVLYLSGKKPFCSTYIDEISISLGYGRLNSLGDWQYPLSKKYIKKEFKGCLRWDVFHSKVWEKKCDKLRNNI